MITNHSNGGKMSFFKQESYPIVCDVVIKKQIWEKAKPFVHLWMSINGEKSLMDKEQKETLIPIAIFCDYGSLFKYLQFGEANYIMIDGLNSKDYRLRGLLCIEEDRKMADEDSCFFIGEMSDGVRKQNVAINARQISEYLGIDAKFMVCKVKIVEKTISKEESLKAFMELSEEYAKDW